jgi:hypothetical protein
MYLAIWIKDEAGTKTSYHFSGGALIARCRQQSTIAMLGNG